MSEGTYKIDEENLRTEYFAITSYTNLVVQFRFLLAGFFLTVVGVLVAFGSGFSNWRAMLLIWLSIVLWFIELRNRSLLLTLAG